MPHFKFRCINKDGDTYDITREGVSYDAARIQAIEEHHNLLPVQPASFMSGTEGDPNQVKWYVDPSSSITQSYRTPRDSVQILESIDAKLSEVLRFTKLARIVLIVMICIWALGFCVWLTMIFGLIGSFARFGR